MFEPKILFNCILMQPDIIENINALTSTVPMLPHQNQWMLAQTRFHDTNSPSSIVFIPTGVLRKYYRALWLAPMGLFPASNYPTCFYNRFLVDYYSRFRPTTLCYGIAAVWIGAKIIHNFAWLGLDWFSLPITYIIIT